jgi:hypothetical protein
MAFEYRFELVSNKRFDMARRADVMRSDQAEAAGAGPTVQTLSPEELNLLTDPPKKPREPIAVLAWIRVNGSPVRIPAECIEFNSRCVLVRFEPPGRPTTQCWVYSGAVTRREAPDGRASSAARAASAEARRPNF